MARCTFSIAIFISDAWTGFCISYIWNPDFKNPTTVAKTYTQFCDGSLFCIPRHSQIIWPCLNGARDLWLGKLLCPKLWSHFYICCLFGQNTNWWWILGIAALHALHSFSLTGNPRQLSDPPQVIPLTCWAFAFSVFQKYPWIQLCCFR